MDLANKDIRDEVTGAGLKMWMVADKFGLNDGNFSRRLRKELCPEDKLRIRAIIAELKEVS